MFYVFGIKPAWNSIKLQYLGICSPDGAACDSQKRVLAVGKTGIFNPDFTIEVSGLTGVKKVHYNLGEAQLYEMAIANGEGSVVAGGALAVTTGQHTGRSATDKFYVRDAETEDAIWWDANAGLSEAHFAVLRDDFKAHATDQATGKELFVQDLYGGADPNCNIRVRIVTEYAWHALFIRHLLRRPDRDELATFVPQLHIFNFPSFTADPDRHGSNTQTVIAASFTESLVLIGGTQYAGEIKKSVFSTLNYLLPEQNIMPMHCSANVGPDGASALFFGLSGTGKTTLSSDVSRELVGDDEHGWSGDGIFNFEGGCYAKTINLSQDAEPEIYATTQRWGSVLENVVIDPVTRRPDFDDGSLTQNGRVAYPINYIPNALPDGVAAHPKNVIMLTADAFGILPPISRLTPAQAMYHFLSGYTAKVAGTEKGVAGTQATFSTCFGAPFMPRHPSVYGNLLKNLIAEHQSTCWLVNTGWTAGAYGTGHRMPIKVTRALLAAALDGDLNSVEMRIDPNFGFEVPKSVAGIDDGILDPRSTWDDPDAYDRQAQKLVEMFTENFVKFEQHVDEEVRNVLKRT
ncbi:Phosphoenolpyruvate carboxykinase [ATP] [hydrothermal vent metagenome]|uniref:phosphoenolpyruvate carboxykinase (ATP) n=1 Tax=hydrothermal vent metagenome TaxID=652676 RepID=A0A3B0S786_9ZZZZ